ncbi:MAG: type II toxin-antitoxin system VapC family toxin [Candidatus Micrarchaeota archaeon]
MYLFDSFAWFEYFFGSEKGKIVKEIIDSDQEIFTSSINLVEVYSKYLRERPDQAEEKRAFMLTRATLVDVSKEIATDASKLKVQYQMGLADCIVLATARSKKVIVLTGDPDFKNFEDAKLI